MEAIHFSPKDAALLYCIPRPGVNLAELIRYYMFTNRDGPPGYNELNDCLTKAMRAGIVTLRDGRFVIEDDWYRRIHAADSTSANEIDSMLEFEEWITAEPQPNTHREAANISREMFDNAILMQRR